IQNDPTLLEMQHPLKLSDLESLEPRVKTVDYYRRRVRDLLRRVSHVEDNFLLSPRQHSESSLLRSIHGLSLTSPSSSADGTELKGLLGAGFSPRTSRRSSEEIATS